MAAAINVQTPAGLTSEEVHSRLEKFGPNAVPDTALHPLRRALTQLWAPVPWMLEAAIVLEIVLGKYIEAAVIAVLLAFNAALGFFQEGRRRTLRQRAKRRRASDRARCGATLDAGALRALWAFLERCEAANYSPVRPGRQIDNSLGVSPAPSSAALTGSTAWTAPEAESAARVWPAGAGSSFATCRRGTGEFTSTGPGTSVKCPGQLCKRL